MESSEEIIIPSDPTIMEEPEEEEKYINQEANHHHHQAIIFSESQLQESVSETETQVIEIHSEISTSTSNIMEVDSSDIVKAIICQQIPRPTTRDESEEIQQQPMVLKLEDEPPIDIDILPIPAEDSNTGEKVQPLNNSSPPGPECIETDESEPFCSCLTCQEKSLEDEQGGSNHIKIKCLICYTIINSPVIFPSAGDSNNPSSFSCEINQQETLGESVEKHFEDILNADDKTSPIDSEMVESSTASAAVIVQETVVTNIEEAQSDCDNIGIGEKLTKDNEHISCAEKSVPYISEEDPQIKLPILFQILGCSMDDVDQETETGLLDQVPLCVPCQSIVTDAVLIFKEIQKLEKTLGNLRETIKDQIVKSFEANYCKRKKETEDIVDLMGQIDIVRRAIISEGISAARILNSFKGSKRGRKKKTIISKSALYPQVTLVPIDGKGRKRGRKVEFDESGVKKESAHEQDDNQNDNEFALGGNEQNEEVSFLQTHSGRRVKRPNYRKWLLAEEDEDEENLVQPAEEQGPISPKSEPEWSPGHTDDEGGEFDSDSDSSGDSDVDFDTEDEEKKDLDELGKLLDQGETFADIETGKRVVRERRIKKKQSKASTNRVKCTECTRTFADDARKDIHFKRKHTLGGDCQTYDCEKCSKQFRRPGLLRKHLQKQHGEAAEVGDQDADGDKKRHMCDFCGQKYRNASELRIHVRLHTGETPYKCEHCDKSFVSSLKREFHIEQSHWEIPPLKCEFCPKAFFRQHRLRIHRISHTGEKAYLCEICSQSFSHPTYLKYHQGQHAELNLETFKCKDCGKVFANPTNLRLHNKTVHLKQFRFHCEVCNMGFTHMSHKRIHMRGHTGERPYKCDLCNESFRYRDRLRIHMRGHTGERPFICDICKKGFASKSKLKRHEKIHEKNQPGKSPTSEEIEQAIRHRCDDCGKGFAEPQHLSAHRRYCQRKSGSEKEERKATKASQSSKSRSIAVTPKETTIPSQQIAQVQQTMSLVPLPINYTYPVTYTYEVQAPYHQTQTGVREYQNYN